MAKKGPKEMTPAHKAALAKGRAEGRAIGDYLDAIAANKPKRGRKRTAESVEHQLAEVTSMLRDATGTARVELAQRRHELVEELAALHAQIDLAAVEAAFVEHAGAYATRKKIGYAAFREVGVGADVLARAGITK